MSLSLSNVNKLYPFSGLLTMITIGIAFKRLRLFQHALDEYTAFPYIYHILNAGGLIYFHTLTEGVSNFNISDCKIFEA